MFHLKRSQPGLKRLFVAIFSIGSVFALSCTNRNGDITRVVDPYWDKAYINPSWEKGLLSPEWYYRMTVVDTPTNTTAASIGDGHWLHPETIRWEITEKFLIGWRAHAAVPGSEGELKNGAGAEYRGAPVAVFRISKHFDIARQYDPVTTEKTNVIQENDVDRVWDKRRFVRVDWSKNLANDIRRQDAYPWVWGSEDLERDNAYVVSQNEPANPKRFRFEDAYFEVTTRQGVKIDIMSYTGGYGEAYRFDSAAPVVDIRMSFMKKPLSSDYEPLHYPDYVTQVDASGQEIRDSNRFSKKMPIWEKFGFYRAAFSGRQNWDLRRGSVESNKNYNITRFNIWKKTYGEDGKLIPIEAREPKPIVYYTNVFHPNSLLNASRKVEKEWNQAFKELVFYAQPGKFKQVSDVPDMWILRENSCNLANVESTLKTVSSEVRERVTQASAVDLSSVKARIAEANDSKNQASFTSRQDQESQAKADLERVCSSLEYYTHGSEKPFRYQRPGDLRYNLLNLITKRVPTAWSGLGPMFADALTGEILQATANINLWYIDRRAAQASDQVDALNGTVAFGDLIFGRDVQSYMSSKLARIRHESSILPSKSALSRMDRQFAMLESSGSLLNEISPFSAERRMAQIAKTPGEAKLFEAREQDELNDLLLLAKSYRRDGGKREFSEELLDQLSPARGNDLVHRMLERKNQLAKMAHTFADPPEFIDNLIVGVALQYKNLSKRERFEKIREAVYTATALHEVGHNMGLAHNMAGSSDAFNYGTRFWQLQALPTDLKLALQQSSDPETRKTLTNCMAEQQELETRASETGGAFVLTTQDCLRQEEHMSASIMDYHASWNSDFGGLGLYDKAAIKFGYAQLVEKLPGSNLKIDASRTDLKRWLFLNDWKKIPTEMVNGADGIHQREHTKYTWNRTSTAFVAPSDEVPYRYCIDSSGTYGPTCKAFDFGPDMRTQARWNKTNYWQHYFLTHFARDQLWSYDLDFSRVISRDLSVMEDFNNMMRWYYFYRAKDQDFKGSDAEKDYLAATVMGLNHLGQVLSHPAPGEHINTPNHMVESMVKMSATEDRLKAANLLVPFGNVDLCTRLNVAELKDGVPQSAKPGYILANVPLGDGRPFYMGLNHDYEDWHMTYVGSFYAKLYAGFFLAYPGAYFPRTDQLVDPRFYSVNWYRLFPKEVGRLMSDIISENWTEIGPVADAEGNIQLRDILDPETLEAPDYSGLGRVLPSMSSFMPYRAMFYAASLMSGNRGSQIDLLKSMRVAKKGSDDDLTTLSALDSSEVAEFIHPDSGELYRALKTGENPIAYNLVKRLSALKDKYSRLKNCAANPGARATDNYCGCVRTSVSRATGSPLCCYPGNPSCPAMTMQKVGEGECSEQELNRRKENAREQMEDAVSYLDDMRWFVKTYSNMP